MDASGALKTTMHVIEKNTQGTFFQEFNKKNTAIVSYALFFQDTLKHFQLALPPSEIQVLPVPGIGSLQDSRRQQTTVSDFNIIVI